MSQREATRARRLERSWSLRREWTRAFVVMLALVLATGVGTILGVWLLVGQFDKVVHTRDVQTSAVRALRISLVDHEQIGHQILGARPVDRAAFLRDQLGIVTRFDQTIQVFRLATARARLSRRRSRRGSRV